MDYIEAFRNLNTNNKFSRPSPHKAILLLTVIDLIERNILTENVIYYTESLKQAFINMWNKVLPGESIFQPEIYLPFWFMQSEAFWHNIPVRGKEDLIAKYKEEHIKPSELKVKELIRYAELDEDLYFLITLPSSRKDLKKVLFETYTNLPHEVIEKYSSTEDTTIDNSLSAIEEYRKILSLSENQKEQKKASSNNQYETEFLSLDDETQISINYEYYAYLKKHKVERDILREICPSVYDLYGRITDNPIHKGDFSPSSETIFEYFLCDLKISLLSISGAFDLIEKIDSAIALIKDNEEQTYHPEILIDDPVETQSIYEVQAPSNNPISIKPKEYSIINTGNRCKILDINGERLYSDEGQLIELDGIIYRFNLKEMCFTVKGVYQENGRWIKTGKLLVAYDGSDLFELISNDSVDCDIQDFISKTDISENAIKVNGIWYDFDGDDIGANRPEYIENNEDGFSPKGQLKNLQRTTHSFNEFLLMLAIVDAVSMKKTSQITFDSLAIMMISNAWEILSKNTSVREIETDLSECVQYLIDESKDEMKFSLNWSSPRDLIYETIKDYPMSGIFEDTVDSLIEDTPFSLLKLWINSDKVDLIETKSHTYDKACLYSIHSDGVEPYIELNPKWIKYLFNERKQLHEYFIEHSVSQEISA